MEKKEAQLYRSIAASIARSVHGHEFKKFYVDIPMNEIMSGAEEDGSESMNLRVYIDMEWVSFEDAYFEDVFDDEEFYE